MKFALLRRFALAAGMAVVASAAIAQTSQESDRPDLDVIYVPTPHKVVKRMLEIAKVSPDDIHYDLGSGDGRIAIASVKDFNAKKSVGIDLDSQRIRESLENLAKAGVGDRVTFLNRNIFETDFSEATVVSLYLLNTLNMKLRPTILKMKPGTRIVTQSFTMSDWKPDHFEVVMHNEAGFSNSRNVYLYVVPANVEGKWTVTQGAQSIALEIKQQFQFFEGTATVGGKTTNIVAGKLDGAKIDFTLEIDGKWVKYEGRVNGEIIDGTGSPAWSAKRP
jgi:precorrin-6B methylase 2